MNLFVEVLLLVLATLGVLSWLADRATYSSAAHSSTRRALALTRARRVGTVVAAAQTLLLFGLTTPQLNCGSSTPERVLVVVAVALSALGAGWFVRRPSGAAALVLWQAYAVTVLVGSVVVAGTTLAVTPCG
ncbi:hypothetical protein [Deinococcus yavapaiensis]|uniref:Uncharacterized protein n=1 Tax=Deinococcus yavapaiensis KR-236 TaxID=694435 RepID=A0A318SGJ2_9DEIO|nr:hypothetical protein [Deinococcus yavapaiensis]PYE56225.1 hypothetical protein DES52_10129 [Deinococcus yavapaiensis KR-236]